MNNKYCVFVVDDDPSARKGITRLLRSAGHDARGFASANEFLETIGPGKTGCIIMDLRMLGMSGEELQTELRKRGSLLPVIVITADDNPEARLKAREMKAAGFFRKPVDGTALLDAIEWSMSSKNRDINHIEK